MSRVKVYNNLIGGSAKGKHPSVMGAELSVNMYSETNGNTTYQASLPGLKLMAGLGSGPCRGSWVSSVGKTVDGGQPELFAVFGDTLYRMTQDMHVTEVGKVDDSATHVVMCESGGLRDQLLIADGVNLWRYDLLEGGKLVQLQLPRSVTGDGMLIRCTHVAVVAGSIVVNDSGSGYVYYSDAYPLNSDKRTVFRIENGKVVYKGDGITVDTVELDSDTCVFLDSYQTQQYFNSESSSDRITGMVAVGDMLYLFGPYSVEIWQRGTEEYQSWLRTSYTTNASNGLAAPYGLAVVGSTVLYVAAGQAYGKCIMAVTGSNYQRISDEWLEAKLQSEDITATYMYAYSRGHHQFVVLQLDTNGETWCYDLSSKTWHQRVSRDSVSRAEVQWRVSDIKYYANRYIAMADGNLYDHADGYYYEDYDREYRIPVVRHRQTPVWVDNNASFIIEQLAVEASVGVSRDYLHEPQLLLEVSKDGAMTWGHVRRAGLGKPGEYSHRCRFLALGQVRLCAIRVTFSDPSDLVLSLCDVVASSTGGIL